MASLKRFIATGYIWDQCCQLQADGASLLMKDPVWSKWKRIQVKIGKFWSNISVGSLIGPKKFNLEEHCILFECLESTDCSRLDLVFIIFFQLLIFQSNFDNFKLISFSYEIWPCSIVGTVFLTIFCSFGRVKL